MFLLLTASDMEESGMEVSNRDYATYLYEKYGKTLWKYAYKLSKNHDISNDMVSTTFLKVIEKIETIKKVHTYKLKSYLMSMVKNTYINYINREKSNVDFDSISEYISFTDDDFTEKVGISEVEDALNHIPEPYKSILISRYVYEEMTYENIAAILNINVKSIRMYKKRAIDMLKTRMKGGETNHE
nr:sigma-70 family RNA polymerase sigma factor [Sedimentibacter sp.]